MADAFTDPFKSAMFGDPFKSSAFGDPFGNKVAKGNPLDTTDELEELALQNGMEKHTPVALNFIQKTGRALNWDVANISGMMIGALRDNMSIMEGRKHGLAQNTGYADVYKELFGAPTSTAGKATLATGALAADIFLSPLTYLSSGTSGYAKAGAKVTKTGFKALQSLDKEFISHAESLVAEGMDKVAARKTSMYMAKRDLNDVTQKILSESKSGKLNRKDYEFLLEKGVSSKTVETLMNLGGHIIDQGGIKYLGKTLVSSEFLSRTPLGKAARRIGEVEVVKTLSNTLGSMFSNDFKINTATMRVAQSMGMTKEQASKAVGKIFNVAESVNLNTMRAAHGITKTYDNIFKTFTEEESVLFHDTGMKMRAGEYEAEAKIRTTAIDEHNSMFPDDKIVTTADAHRIYTHMDDDAVKEITKREQSIGKIVDKEFDKLADRTVKSGGVDLDSKFTPFQLAVQKLSALEKHWKGMVDTGERELGKKKAMMKVGDDGEELTSMDAMISNHMIIQSQTEKVWGKIEALSKKIEGSQAKPTGESAESGLKKQAVPEITDAQKLTQLTKEIRDIQADLSARNQSLNKIINARKIARAEGAKVRVEFPGNTKLQKAADEIWNNKKSLTAQLAKLAGIPEDQAYKFYIRPYYQDYVDVKKAQIGRSMSPLGGKVKQDFTKMWTPDAQKVRGDVIKNPAESFKRAHLEVATAKIKTQGIKSIYRAFEKQTLGRTDAELEALGFVKYEKKVLNEKLSGWIPKAIHDEVVKFADPKMSLIDELARNTGFDWSTNMMKAWSTSLFSAFHILNLSSNQFQLHLKLGMSFMDPGVQMSTTRLATIIAFPVDGILRKTLRMGAEWENKFMKETFKDANGKTWTNSEMIKEIKKHSNILDANQFGDIEQGIKTIANQEGVINQVVAGKFVDALVQMNPLSLNFRPLQIGRSIGNFGEVQAKLVAIQMGIKEGKAMKANIKDAEDAIFNYSNLTDFERQFMKRLIPFYTFAKKNAEFQVKMLSTNPGRVASQFKLFNNINSSFGNSMDTENETGLPSFVVDKLGINGGKNKYGQQEVITGFGLPIEEFLGRFSGERGFAWNAMKNVMAQGNPLLKYPTEQITGVDLYKGRPIVEIDNGEGMKGIITALGGQDSAIGKEFADLVGFKEVPNQPRFINGIEVGTYTKYIADPYKLHFFRNLPTARLQRTVQKGEKEAVEEYRLRSIAGFSTFSVDEEREAFFKDLERKEEITRWLDRAGIINSKEIYYIPKPK